MEEQLQERYLRQLVMDEVGKEGQVKLAKARVLVVGAGGLGSPVCLYLAAAGIGHLGIVDSDTVSLTNLNRQILYITPDLGRPKVQVAKEKINMLNPSIEITVYQVPFSGETAMRMARSYDAMVDATDNLKTRELINRVALQISKPFFHGAVSHFYGQVMTVIPGAGPCWRCFMGDIAPESEPKGVPVLGPVAGVVGSLQALQVLKYFLGAGDQLVGKVLMFDGLQMTLEALTVARDSNCPACQGY